MRSRLCRSVGTNGDEKCQSTTGGAGATRHVDVPKAGKRSPLRLRLILGRSPSASPMVSWIWIHRRSDVEVRDRSRVLFLHITGGNRERGKLLVLAQFDTWIKGNPNFWAK